MQTQDLPRPSLEAQNHSQRLQAYIKQACENSNGLLSFKSFMNMALYQPGLGYYSAGCQKFGPEGDFVTAPEISPLFGQTLSFALDTIFNYFDKNNIPFSILELGAGTGKLAGDLLENLKNTPQKYFILEVSADLIERQKNYLKNRLTPLLFDSIEWLPCLPSTPFAGVILANEIIDAMPVHKFKVIKHQNKINYLEYYVSCKNNQFEWQLGPLSTPELQSELSDLFEQELENNFHDTHNNQNYSQEYSENYSLEYNSEYNSEYISEINTDLTAWLRGLSNCLTTGVMLFIDYGFPSHEYYHPDRNMGTLSCHYRHTTHSDVFQYIGLSDITAHVDFTALAKAADANQLKVAGFTTQGAYLIDNQLAHFAERALQDLNKPASYRYQISQQIQQLTHPHEMGELFKVMALTKAWDYPLSGFDTHDHLRRL